MGGTWQSGFESLDVDLCSMLCLDVVNKLFSRKVLLKLL